MAFVPVHMLEHLKNSTPGIRDQIETARLTLESANLSASSANGSLEDYKITSPISGTVIEKNFKAGDKVDGSASGTLAVIYDLSSLKMQMNVNELDIGKVKAGQTVDITAAALPGEAYTGTVERVSVNGTTKDGFTTYPVTIAIPEFGGLMPVKDCPLVKESKRYFLSDIFDGSFAMSLHSP